VIFRKVPQEKGRSQFGNWEADCGRWPEKRRTTMTAAMVGGEGREIDISEKMTFVEC
jgi:hypothetical protein